MQKYISSLLIIILTTIFTIACSSDSQSNNSNSSIEGFIQKGPFIQGSEVFIQEVDNNLIPTGNLFITETIDDSGSFYLEANINTEYVDIRTTGFYFNEASGNLSNANITLNAIVETVKCNNININILTSLSYERIKYLILNNNMSFLEAQEQAEYEVLNIFNIDKNTLDTQVTNFYQMDITKEGISNAILLAVSSIMQWENSEAELSELSTKIGSDIKIDGTLDNTIYINELKNNSINLKLATIRNNIKKRYESLGVTITIPNFEDFIDSDGNGIISLYETKDPTFEVLNPDPVDETTSLLDGGYDHDISVSLSSETENAIIYYTTDGSEPIYTSDVYSNPIQISGDGTIMTIKAFAVKEGLADSNVVSVTFFIEYPKTLQANFSYHAGTYDHDISVSLSSETENAIIYYTTDGSEPIYTSDVYSNPIQISGDGTIMTIKAFAVKDNMKDGDLVTSYYKIDYDFDPSQYITNLTLNDYNTNIVGTWIGYSQNPWGYGYNVEITFFDNGNYSAHSLTPTGKNYWSPAFYYGTDEDSPMKEYNIHEIYTDGKALANIDINFGTPGTLRYITFYNNYNNLSFEFFHMNQYGPIKFTLTRKE